MTLFNLKTIVKLMTVQTGRGISVFSLIYIHYCLFYIYDYEVQLRPKKKKDEGEEEERRGRKRKGKKDPSLLYSAASNSIVLLRFFLSLLSLTVLHCLHRTQTSAILFLQNFKRYMTVSATTQLTTWNKRSICREFNGRSSSDVPQESRVRGFFFFLSRILRGLARFR